MDAAADRSCRLLPSERVLWQGGPTPGVPRDLRWTVAVLLLLALAVIGGLFAGLLHASGLPGTHSGVLDGPVQRERPGGLGR